MLKEVIRKVKPGETKSSRVAELFLEGCSVNFVFIYLFIFPLPAQV